MTKTQGLVAAPPTAFRDDGGIDLGVVAPLAQHLRRQGVVGAFVNGTTGEGMSLSTQEREQLAAEWRKQLPAGMRLFVHVGHNSQAECRRLAQHAQAIAFIDSLVATGNSFAALKAVLRAQGVPITPVVRLPLVPVVEEKLALLSDPLTVNNTV